MRPSGVDSLIDEGISSFPEIRFLNTPSNEVNSIKKKKKNPRSAIRDVSPRLKLSFVPEESFFREIVFHAAVSGRRCVN
jgi:hypothetical protein